MPPPPLEPGRGESAARPPALVSRRLVPWGAEVATEASGAREFTVVITKYPELFAEAMLEKSRTRPPRRTGHVLISLAVHGVLLTALVLIPLLFTSAIDFQMFNRTHLAEPPAPPPPPPAAASHPASAPKKRLLPATARLVAPRFIPKQVGAITDEPPGVDQLAGSGSETGAPGGVPGGQPGGVPGGILFGTGRSYTPPPPPVESVPGGPIRVGGNVKEPRMIFRPELRYPTLAKQAKIFGDVLVDAVIDPRGNVVEMHAVSGNPMLVQAALDWVKQCRFEPTFLNGQPIPVKFFVTVHFTMH